jgi:hypothetical protein
MSNSDQTSLRAEAIMGAIYKDGEGVHRARTVTPGPRPAARLRTSEDTTEVPTRKTTHFAQDTSGRMKAR